MLNKIRIKVGPTSYQRTMVCNKNFKSILEMQLNNL